MFPTNLPCSSTTAHAPHLSKAMCLNASIGLSLLVIEIGREPTGWELLMSSQCILRTISMSMPTVSGPTSTPLETRNLIASDWVM